MNKEEEIFRVATEIQKFQDKMNQLQQLDHEQLEVHLKQIVQLKLRLQKLEESFYLGRDPDQEGEKIDLYLKNIYSLMDEKTDHYEVLWKAIL
ncbi:MAG: hypothetical protein PUB18_03350 [bacterium]|nr:hypothetical protein [bacterium]